MRLIIRDNGKIIVEKDLSTLTGSLTLGRHSDCDILLPGGGISRHHARLHKINEAFFVEDTNSSTGVTLNGEKISADKLKQLAPVDKIKHVKVNKAGANGKATMEITIGK